MPQASRERERETQTEGHCAAAGRAQERGGGNVGVRCGGVVTSRDGRSVDVERVHGCKVTGYAMSTDVRCTQHSQRES